MKPAFNPKRVETRKPRGPVKRNVLPFYKAIGDARRVYDTRDACDGIPEQNRGRVMLDLNAVGDVIGVEIIG